MLQVFSHTGDEITDFLSIRADPADCNVIPGTKRDPRVVENLIDGVNLTCDATHMWLAPYCRGADHLIFLTLARPAKIAMIRIWNYNESRAHTLRGARLVSVSLDSRVIFKARQSMLVLLC